MCTHRAWWREQPLWWVIELQLSHKTFGGIHSLWAQYEEGVFALFLARIFDSRKHEITESFGFSYGEPGLSLTIIFCSHYTTVIRNDEL